MKFNTTYISKLNLKTTIKEIEYIKNELLNLIKSNFNLTEVSVPVFLEEDDEKNILLKEITRDLSFDLLSDSKIVRNVISPSNFMRDLIDRLKLLNKEGLITSGKYLYRDLIESPSATVVKEEVNIQIKFNDEKNINNEIKKINEMIYKKIYELASYIENKYQIENIFESEIYYALAQDLENENPNQSSKEREINLSLEQPSYILVNQGKVLHSGKRHSNIPIEIYDLSNFYQLILRDRINTSVIKPVQVSILANGVQLSDQLSLYDKEQFKQLEFYKKLMSQHYKVVEIRLNIPRIAMSILGKGHICEVQPGVTSDEVHMIEQKYNVEKY